MRVLVFGDSITQGIQDTEKGGWSNRLNAYLMSKNEKEDWKNGYQVFDLGVSGDCTNRLLARFDAEAGTRAGGGEEECVIIFAIGVNDTQRYVTDNHIKTPLERFNENLETLHINAGQYADKIVFLGILPIREEIVQPMPWADDRGHYVKDVRAYDAAIEQFCDDKNCLFIPMQDMFNGELAKYLPDGIHPNAEGHRLIFERVKSSLEKAKIL